MYDIQLRPGKTEILECTGNFFAIALSPIGVYVRIHGEEEIYFEQGDSRTLAAGTEFRYLTLRNPTAQTVTVRIYAGTGRYEQRRTAVIEPKRRVEGFTGTLPIAADPGSVIDLDDSLGDTDIRIKAYLVSNADPNNKLEVLDSAGVRFQIIQPDSSVVVQASEGLKLKNPNAAPVDYCYGKEIWTY